MISSPGTWGRHATMRLPGCQVFSGNRKPSSCRSSLEEAVNGGWVPGDDANGGALSDHTDVSCNPLTPIQSSSRGASVQLLVSPAHALAPQGIGLWMTALWEPPHRPTGAVAAKEGHGQHILARLQNLTAVIPPMLGHAGALRSRLPSSGSRRNARVDRNANGCRWLGTRQSFRGTACVSWARDIAARLLQSLRLDPTPVQQRATPHGAIRPPKAPTSLPTSSKLPARWSKSRSSPLPLTPASLPVRSTCPPPSTKTPTAHIQVHSSGTLRSWTAGSPLGI